MTGSTNQVDPTARIGEAVRLEDNVTIGPFVIIEGEVSIGAGTVIGPFCVIRGPTRIGRRNHFYQYCSVGEDCQDLKYHGEVTRLEIGDDNLIREHCSLHRGTVQGGGVTRVGSNNLLMINTHIAHDCQVGSHCIFANNATLAGHVSIGDWAILGGLVGVHQFVRIGAHAFIGGLSRVTMDVPPYVMAVGEKMRPYGINKEGLRRRGFSEASISAIAKAYMLLYHKHLTHEEALQSIEKLCEEHSELRIFADFLRQSGRGIIR